MVLQAQLVVVHQGVVTRSGCCCHYLLVPVDVLVLVVREVQQGLVLVLMVLVREVVVLVPLCGPFGRPLCALSLPL